MDHVQDAFVRRLLQRASLRRSRNSDGTTKPDNQALQRRHTIIKAIKEPFLPTKNSYDDNDNNKDNVSPCIAKLQFSENSVLSVDSELPVMESTRKVPHSDSTKILYSPSTKRAFKISMVAMFVETRRLKKIDGDSEEIRGEDGNATAAYDQDDFLEDALGEELNNSSVTYDNPSVWNKSDSDFDASDLVSENEYPMELTFEELFALTMKEMQPRSSSTLNRSMTPSLLASQEETEPRNERGSRLRNFFRLLRRFPRNFKKVLSLKASSKR